MVHFVFSFRLHCSFHSPGSTMELCKSKPIIACETKFHKIECVRENAEKCYDFAIVLWIKSFFCDNYGKLMHATRAKYSIARYQSAFFPSKLETNLKTVTLKILLSTWNLGFSSHISLVRNPYYAFYFRFSFSRIFFCNWSVEKFSIGFSYHFYFIMKYNFELYDPNWK